MNDDNRKKLIWRIASGILSGVIMGIVYCVISVILPYFIRNALSMRYEELFRFPYEEPMFILFTMMFIALGIAITIFQKHPISVSLRLVMLILTIYLIVEGMNWGIIKTQVIYGNQYAVISIDVSLLMYMLIILILIICIFSLIEGFTRSTTEN